VRPTHLGERWRPAGGLNGMSGAKKKVNKGRRDAGAPRSELQLKFSPERFVHHTWERWTSR
jgi:hypothetical protein